MMFRRKLLAVFALTVLVSVVAVDLEHFVIDPQGFRKGE